MINPLLYITCPNCPYINISDGEINICPSCGEALQIQKFDTFEIGNYEELRKLHKEILRLWTEARTRHDQELNKYLRIGTPPISVENIQPLTRQAIDKLNDLSRQTKLVEDFLHQFVYPKYSEFPNPVL